VIETQAIIDAVVSHAQVTGQFERVNTHEPKNAPGTGLTCAVWAQSLGPARGRSGLKATTALLMLNVRVYSPIIQDPPDMIDPTVITAVDALMGSYSGDFTLDGLVANVDLLGAYGLPMASTAGYLTIGGNKMYRVVTISLPLVINDVWDQEA
jgi:hypothetical protein